MASDFERVMRKPLVTLKPRMFALVLVLAIVLVLSVAMPLVSSAWHQFDKAINPPVLTYNPYGHVVKVTEADGKVLTSDAGARFDQRVSQIKKAGRYDKDYTGKVNGRP